MRNLGLLLAVSLGQAGLAGCSTDAFIAIGPDGGGSSGSSTSGSAGSGSSSGTAGSGSVSSDAASSGSGSSGSTGSGASSGSGSCPASGATVSFEMKVSPTLNTSYCYGAGSCSQEFVAIRAPNGADLTIDKPCLADCNACRLVACPAGCLAPGPLTTTGVNHVWDGTHWSSGTCGSNVTCTGVDCTPAGHYVATMCAYRNIGGPAPSCTSSQTPICKEFGFDWPPPNGSVTISWTIGDADAGTTPSDGGPACFRDPVPADYKGCTVDGDCTVKSHQTDCCGTLHELGVSKSLSSAYDACESAWDQHFPACGCAAMATTTEDGKTVSDPSMVAVHCLGSSAAGAKTCQTTLSLPPADAGGKGVCSSTGDCPPNSICGFPTTPVCGATGQCFPVPGIVCQAYAPGCACDGTEINIVCNGLPGGYETKPLRHTGACVDGG